MGIEKFECSIKMRVPTQYFFSVSKNNNNNEIVQDHFFLSNNLQILGIWSAKKKSVHKLITHNFYIDNIFFLSISETFSNLFKKKKYL